LWFYLVRSWLLLNRRRMGPVTAELLPERLCVVGTEMYRATKNLFAVMNVMGHTTVSTTMKYQHQNIDEVAAVASRRVQ